MAQPIDQITQRILEATGWTETQLAEVVGVSQPTINRIRSGQKDCKLATYQRLVEILTEVTRE